MLKNKKFQLIISLLIAIALWLYVVGEVDPTITADVNHIQVEMTGEDTLEELGMEATLEKPKVIDIVISGPRSDVNEAKSGEIRAIVDVSNCEYGDNEENIRIQFPDDVKRVSVINMSSEKAEFTVE